MKKGEAKAYTGYFDGACEPVNPGGIATYGYALYDERGEIVTRGHGVASALTPQATNNYAEYTALVSLLEKALELGVEEISVRGDSELVVRQMNGVYAVRSPNVAPLYEKAKELSERFTRFNIAWVPRERNAEADRLSHLAYEEYLDREPRAREALANHFATEKQVAFLRRLGVETYRCMGKRDASRLIERALRET